MEHLYSTQHQSPLFALPPEIRLAIYELAFTSDKPTLIGHHAVGGSNLASWPTQPALTRTSWRIHEEALPVYFSCTNFKLNLQSIRGLDMILKWIDRCSDRCRDAFNELRHVTIVANSGLNERPEDTEIDFHEKRIVVIRPQLPLPPWTKCPGPPFDMLKIRLSEMPDRRTSGFDGAAHLRDCVELFVDRSLKTDIRS